MKKWFIGLLVLLVGCTSNITAQAIESKPIKKQKWANTIDDNYESIDPLIVNDVQDFTAKIVPELFTQENNIASPLSYYLALQMVVPFSKDATKDQLIEFLGESEMNQETLKILEYHNEVGTMQLANSMWLHHDANFNTELMQSISRDYRASIYRIDFQNKQQSQTLMNDWINQMTHGFIKDVDVDLSNNVDKVIALVNTIFLKDKWVTPFHKDRTQSDLFHIDQQTTVTTDFMNQNKTMPYLENDHYQMVSKPLANDSRANFILPKENLNELSLHDVFSSLSQSEIYSVDLSLPKFDLTSEYNLIDTSKALGLTLPFEENTSELYPLESDLSVYISSIQQQARLKIDEEGLEAAAYTNVGVGVTSAPSYPEVKVSFNKPFLVIITSPQEIPLFVGTVVDPSQ